MKRITLLECACGGALQRAGISPKIEDRRRWLGIDPMGAIGEGPSESGLTQAGQPLSVADFIQSQLAAGAKEPALVKAFESAGKSVGWILEVLADLHSGVFVNVPWTPTPDFLGGYLAQHPAEATT